MQIDIPQEKLDSVIESTIKQLVSERLSTISYEIKNEAEKQFNLAFTWKYWANKDFTAEVSDAVKKKADEEMEKYFQAWFDKKLQESFRHKINDFVRSQLEKELKRACENIKVWFTDEDADIENYMWEIANDMANWAYESGCRDGYNER